MFTHPCLTALIHVSTEASISRVGVAIVTHTSVAPFQILAASKQANAPVFLAFVDVWKNVGLT